MITVAETSTFQRKAREILSKEEYENLIEFLAKNPTAGVLVKGGGGIRKLRWASGGKGKRGGSRVIYFHHSQNMPLYLLTIYAKNEKVDLSPKDLKEISTIVQTIKDAWRESNDNRRR
ncbi:MAG: type II toxin-antitoxin system RelE/ParE family toxin [Candidatus Omnitrophica bacterium]|nr:type II toxin-antitoxin system RelE/ParE family toxin [Candidatus Omnitrophota bacterium]